MHLLIPYAAPMPDAGAETLRGLRLPGLDALLRRWGETARDDGPADSLSPPHERAIARAHGWREDDGRLPFAALEAERAGAPAGDLAWAVFTPVHCHVGAEGVSLADPQALSLSEADSRALCEAARPLFEGEDRALLWRSSLVWLAAHPALRDLATASLDRVVARPVEPWLPPREDSTASRRLQVEVQMLLHEHPVNAEREARGLLPVNSVWISGCGPHQPARAADLRVDDRLRGPALAQDWDAWRDAWQALDAGPVAALRDDDTALTLCGERSALRLEPRAGGLWRRLRRSVQGRRAVDLLETL